jgi:membrane protein
VAHPRVADPSADGKHDGGPTHDRGRDYLPEGVDRKTGLWPTLRRTAAEFNEDGLTDWAAALTYYGLLALFPALIALVSIVGLVADPDWGTRTLTDIVSRLGPKSATDTFSGPIREITANRGTAGVALVAGTLVALWSASGYLGAFIRASNVIYETREGRPFWKLRPIQLLTTLVLVLLLAAVALGVVMTGPIVSAVAGPLGVSDAAVTVWNIAKWPVIAAIFVVMIGVLYYTAPNVRQRGIRFITPGSLVALAVWLIASGAFGVYVANFGSYNKTYGALATAAVVLVWFWITNVAILFGHELNAERERDLELRQGLPGADRAIQLRPRSEPKPRRTI